MSSAAAVGNNFEIEDPTTLLILEKVNIGEDIVLAIGIIEFIKLPMKVCGEDGSRGLFVCLA